MSALRPRLLIDSWPTPDALVGPALDQLVDALADRIAAKVAERIDVRLATITPADSDALLSYQQVADLLTARTPPPASDIQRPTVAYVSDLVRRGELASVPFGKYRRIRLEDYRAWVARVRVASLDDGLYRGYRTSRGRRGIQASTPQDSQIESGETRPSPGRHRDVGGALGAERATDLGAHRTVRPRPRRDRVEGLTRPRRPRRPPTPSTDDTSRNDTRENS